MHRAHTAGTGPATIFIHNGAPQALVGCYENNRAGRRGAGHDVEALGSTVTITRREAPTNRPAPPPFSSIMARRRRWLAAKHPPDFEAKLAPDRGD